MNTNLWNIGLYDIWFSAHLLRSSIWIQVVKKIRILFICLFWLQHHFFADGVFPTNTDKPFYDKKMRRTKAYEKAIKLILKNPRKNFCQIKRSWSGYTLKCWTSSSLKDPKFESGNGNVSFSFPRRSLFGRGIFLDMSRFRTSRLRTRWYKLIDINDI